jgi:hypothetical protein
LFVVANVAIIHKEEVVEKSGNHPLEDLAKYSLKNQK